MTRLAQRVHSKLLTEFDCIPDRSEENEKSATVDAMLCGFILEGESLVEPLDVLTIQESDWYFNC